MNKLSPLWLLLLFFTLSSRVYGEELPFYYEPSQPDHYYTMVDAEGTILLETGRVIAEGDQYLTAKNELYEVTSVDEHNIARAIWKETVTLPTTRFSLQGLKKELGLTQVETAEAKGTIAIYHTHNAESYVPSDGTHSIDGKGGIHDVGAAFSSALNKHGVNTDYAEALHLPHDRGAYRRSRNTVIDLLSREPDALFDVHRDAAPAHAYAAEIGGNWVTQIQFVVGRQNQNFSVNREYAKSLKAVADTVHPNLVKGIFFGSGNYNQDLTPLNLLLEVGAHRNSKEAAIGGITLLADVIQFYFYGPSDETGTRRQGVPERGILASSKSSTLLLLMLFVSAGVVYVAKVGGLENAKNQVQQYFKTKRKKRLR